MSWSANRIAVMSVLALFLVPAGAQRAMEKISRGLVAIPKGEGHFLSWRHLGTEPANTAYNLYKGTTRLNSAPLTGPTHYQDDSPGTGVYTVRAVVNDVEQAASAPALVFPNGEYYTIPLQIPPSGSNPSGNYTYNDRNVGQEASIGDLDGDGEFELVVKHDPSDAHDNAHDGHTGPVYIDAYKLDGTRMWRINMGPNVRAGQHYTQVLVYDFDGDGKAEIMMRTADGTVDGAGTVIGDASARYVNSNGKVLAGPEFLSVFEGATGKILKSMDYQPARGNITAWGDNTGNRVDRFLATVVYLDGQRPSAMFSRGYYTRTVLVAWDWRNGELTRRWIFDTNEPGTPAGYTGQGCHCVMPADVDGDGKDEIMFGAMAVDDDGKPLHTTRYGHGDAMHVGDLDPARPGMEVFMSHENPGSRPGMSLRNAKTGEIYFGAEHGADHSHASAADVDSTRPGYEFWAGADQANAPGAIYSVAGTKTGETARSSNMLVWWDGDLLRELEDVISITKHGGGTLLTATGAMPGNWNKSVPVLIADLWGDWREEVIWRTSTGLRVYTSTIPTSHRLYTLLQNPQYRQQVATQNVVYNQPPHPDFYLGVGMAQPPRPNIAIVGGPVFIPRAPSDRRLSHRPVIPGRGFILPRDYTGSGRSLSAFDLSGRSSRKTAAPGSASEMRRNLGLAEGLYILRD